ncbi:hypothetical protein MPDQ_007698 [Monascus purpureus]|uniref:Nuclear pore complex protein An-Nup82 n=1 Tax=Monascus purpureus TaxID=5098 RepID=A0A507QRH8_MONPU|nr:hypothetical protein MPDQ_007698 [Monascus purpureus]
MPKVVSYTPPWLSRPSPGATLFSSAPSKIAEEELYGQNKTAYEGPRRTLARRGNEVFAVVDNQIRWSSLTRLKDEWQQQSKLKKGFDGKAQDEEAKEKREYYRVLTVPVSDEIRQIIPSPNGAFMAIITDHTVHISVIPDSSHLASSDTSPIRLKTYQLGPTTHVIPQSPVVSAIWHPLGLQSNLMGCIVTVTADSAVRVWELDRNNHWSFDRPTLAIDLKKLVDGTSSDQDFSPLAFGQSKGFSADGIDMETVSACFAGSGHESEDVWAPMTLWVAMRPGDLYALCPLLPSRWQAPSTTIPSLSATIVPKLGALEEDPEDSEDQLTYCRQQYEWLRTIDEEGPLFNSSDLATIPGAEVFTRPANPSAVPRLQGPFRFDDDDVSDDLDLCDLLVIPAKIDVADLMIGEEDELVVEESGKDKLSVTVLCLSTASGVVHICLNLDGVEGQWLPKTKPNTFSMPFWDASELVLVESLGTVREDRRQSNSWPIFTKDVRSAYEFYVTNANNVVCISFSPWVQRLEAELQSEDTSGSAFRLQVLCEGLASSRERVIQVDDEADSSAVVKSQKAHLASSIVFYDYDVGYLLLTYRSSLPYAAILDSPEVSFPSLTDLPALEAPGQLPGPSLPLPRRPPYQVPAIFYSGSPLESFVEKHVPHRQRHTLKEQVRLSPATLDMVAAAHRILSAHTNALERAASDLFRRCELLGGEIRDQLKQLGDVAERIHGVSSELEEDGKWKEGSRSGDALDKRLQAAKDRQKNLVQRYENLRNRILNSGGRPLSRKEEAWISEVNVLSESVGEPDQTSEGGRQTLSERLEDIKTIASSLLSEAKSISAKAPPSEPGSPARGLSTPSAKGIPQRLQRARTADTMRMVERESAVIDAITSRLERLNTSISSY